MPERCGRDVIHSRAFCPASSTFSPPLSRLWRALHLIHSFIIPYVLSFSRVLMSVKVGESDQTEPSQAAAFCLLSRKTNGTKIPQISVPALGFTRERERKKHESGGFYFFCPFSHLFLFIIILLPSLLFDARNELILTLFLLSHLFFSSRLYFVH